MHKVTQIGSQDSLAASLASLLELPLGVVPVFERTKTASQQLRKTQIWLSKIGFTLIEIPVIKGERCKWRGMAIATPAIVCFQITKRLSHAVVGTVGADGIRVVFDPSPTVTDFSKCKMESVMFLAPAIPAKTALENLRLLKY